MVPSICGNSWPANKVVKISLPIFSPSDLLIHTRVEYPSSSPIADEDEAIKLGSSSQDHHRRCSLDPLAPGPNEL